MVDSPDDVDLQAAIKALDKIDRLGGLEPGHTTTLKQSQVDWDLYSRVKGEQRASQKVAGKSPVEAQTTYDYLGFIYKVDNPGQVRDIINKMVSKGYRLLEEDDYILKPKEAKGGWRSANLKFQTPNRSSAVELQLVPRTFKETGDISHAVYQITRLDTVKKNGVPLVTDAQSTALNKRMNQIAESSWQRFEAEGSYSPTGRSVRGMPAPSSRSIEQGSISPEPGMKPVQGSQPDPVQTSASRPPSSEATIRTIPVPPTIPAIRTFGSPFNMGRASTRIIPTDVTPGNYLKGVKVGDLPTELRSNYLQAMNGTRRRAAVELKDKLLDPIHGHGVVDGLEGVPPHLRKRTLNIPYSMVEPYLDNSARRSLLKYDHQIAGEIGIRRALADNSETLQPYADMLGRPIEKPSDIKDVLDHHFSTMTSAADMVGDTKLSQQVSETWRKVNRDMLQPMELMRGKGLNRASTDPREALAYFGRNIQRYNFVNKLGSVFWAQMNDIAPQTLMLAENPRNLKFIPAAMNWTKNLAKKDLETLGLYTDRMSRTRAIADLDFDTLDYGFGSGVTKQITAAIEAAAIKGSDVSGHVSGMNWITNSMKRLGGMQTLQKIGDITKKMVRADDLVRGGMDLSAAMKKVRLTNWQAAKMNHLGFDVAKARRFHRLTYAKGITRKGDDIRGKMTYEKYMRNQKDLFLPNFEEWNTSVAANRSLLDTMQGRMRDEVNRHLVVTPGFFDKPLMNQHMLGRMFNQFQTFMSAFLGQRLVPMAQMPAHMQAWYYANYMVLGGMTDAITNHLSGRRDFTESAKLWGENPLGMAYKAFAYSGLSGPINRPWGVMDALGFGPGNLVNNTVGGGASQGFYYGDPGMRTMVQSLGPTGTSAATFGDVAYDVLGPGDADKRTAYRAATLLPFQNQAILRIMYKSTGLPVVPQYFKDQYSRKNQIGRRR